MKHICDVCGWEYDEELGYPEGGIAPGTKWEDVPEDFECPLCFVGKDQFSGENPAVLFYSALSFCFSGVFFSLHLRISRRIPW